MRLSVAPRWSGGHHPVGDAKSSSIRLSFNPQLRVEFRGATVTSDAGLLLPRELDERLGLDALMRLLAGALEQAHEARPAVAVRARDAAVGRDGGRIHGPPLLHD